MSRRQAVQMVRDSVERERSTPETQNKFRETYEPILSAYWELQTAMADSHQANAKPFDGIWPEFSITTHSSSAYDARADRYLSSVTYTIVGPAHISHELHGQLVRIATKHDLHITIQDGSFRMSRWLRLDENGR